MGKSIITPPATLSYPYIAEPQESQGSSGTVLKYSAALVFPGGTDLTELVAAATAAATEKWGAKGEVMLAGGSARTPFRLDAAAKGYPAGSTFINVRSNSKPGCVFAHAGPDGRPERMSDDEIEEQLYPGALVRASVSAFAYDRDGNKGVSFGLNNVQKLGDAPRLDGRVAAEDDFGADLSAAPADLTAAFGGGR